MFAGDTFRVPRVPPLVVANTLSIEFVTAPRRPAFASEYFPTIAAVPLRHLVVTRWIAITTASCACCVAAFAIPADSRAGRISTSIVAVIVRAFLALVPSTFFLCPLLPTFLANWISASLQTLLAYCGRLV